MILTYRKEESCKKRIKQHQGRERHSETVRRAIRSRKRPLSISLRSEIRRKRYELEEEIEPRGCILQVQLTLRNEYDPGKVPSSPCPFVRNKSANVLHKYR